MNTLRVLAVAMLLTVSLRAQDVAGVRGEVPGTRKRLVAAEDLLRAGQVTKAREALAAIIDDAGDDLIQITEGRYQSARLFAQTLLAKLPEEQLNIYRTRIDAAAAKLLTEGRERRDPKPLLELIDRYSVSRPAEEALTLLGELAFERGEFSLAENYWTRIATKTPQTQARIVLAIYFQHDAAEKPPRVAAAFAAFEKAHPSAQGFLAGREGKFVDILRSVLTLPPVATPAIATSLDWPTLGANASRTGSVPGSLAALPPSPLWSVPIPGAKQDGSPRLGTVRRVAFHPVLDGANAYLADASRITGFDLATGKAFTVFDAHALKQEAATLKNAAVEPAWRDADFTLTLHRGRIFSRLGTVAIIPGDAALASHLVCVSHAGGTPQVHWARKPPAAAGILAGWEGSPLVVDGQVIAAFSRVEGGRVIQAMACYGDADKPLWTADVCELGLGAAEGRERHELLTLTGANVVFASHTGIVAAVNRRTGKHAWTIRYPRVMSARHRDISPPVVSDGTVFVAPNDSDRLFALDADTGHLRWQSQPLAVDHILGVARSRVIAAIAGPNRGLRAFDARTGSDSGTGWQQHDDSNLPTVGRGAIVGDLIAWPTQTGLYLIRLADGEVARPPLRDVQGNIAFAGGRMLVASSRSLSLYTAPGVAKVEESYPLMVFAPPGKEPVKSRKAFAAQIPPSLRPIIANPAKLEVITRLQSGRYFQTPQNDLWGSGPALLDDSTVADSAIYRGNDVLVKIARSWRLRKLDDTPVWSKGFDDDASINWQLKVSGDRIVASLNSKHVLGMTLSDGKCDWCVNTRGGHTVNPYRIESAPRFDDCFLADEVTVVRRTDDRVWILDTATGERIDDLPCDSGPWQTPPVRLDDAIIAVPSGPGQIRAYDAAKRSTTWTYDAGLAASLSGAAPQIQRDETGLLVIIDRNHACECLRLDRLGRPLWASPAPLTGPTHILDSDSDSSRVYVPLSDRLIALSKDNGSLAWETPLSEAGRWRVIVLGNTVSLVPRTMALATPRISAAVLHQPFPMFCGLADGLRGPVLLFDPETGELRQRIDSFDGPLISATVADSGLWLATARTIYRLK